MQEVADATYARSMTEANDGDERMKVIIEAQLVTMKAEITSMRMAATQAAIIQGSSRPASVFGPSEAQRACGPFGASNGNNHAD